MKRLSITTLFLAIAACIAFFAFQQGPLDADVHTNEIVVDAVTRNYRIVVPHNCPTPTRIVLAFHGIGDSTDSMATYTQLDRLAAQNSFVLVYPAAENSMWETVNVDPSKLDSHPDVRFIDQLLTYLSTVLDIDRNRVYLMGMSNGASFAQLLGAARSDQVAALTAHSGSRPKGLHDYEDPLPIMLVVGADDPISNIMAADADQYRSAGHKVEYIQVPSLAHEWSTRHNIDMWRFLSQYARHAEDVAEPSDGREVR